MILELISDAPYSSFIEGYGDIALEKGGTVDVPDWIGKALLGTGRFRERQFDIRPIPQNTLTLKRKAK